MKFLKKHKTDCILFTGYKPCSYKYENCIDCSHYKVKGKLICLINLDAMGDVLMTTALLQPIKRKYPASTVIWVTERSSIPLLQNNPLIDKVMAYDFDTYMSLKPVEFDLVLNADKSLRSAGLAMSLQGKIKKGFQTSVFGTLIPFNEEAQYSYELGLNDQLKFKQNTLTGQQILAESFGFEYKRDEYIYCLDQEQLQFIKDYKEKHKIKTDDIIVGFNTGCSALYPNKKFSPEHIIKLCQSIHEDFPEIRIALFGGRDETERNQQIKESLNFPVFDTPTTEGLKKGIAVMDIADIVCSGDTLGMHIGIALKKLMVVWFNISCASEIDLYDRGEKVISQEECSPCWKQSCDALTCLDNIKLDEIYAAIKRQIQKTKDSKNSHH